MTAYNFKPNGKFFIRLKRYDPDCEDIKRAFSMFYISIGALASITQTAIKDTHDYLRQQEALYKREVKFNIKQADERIDGLIAVFKKYTTQANSYTMWLDITDGLEDTLKADIQKAFYSLDNHLLRYANGGDHTLVAHAVLAFNLSAMLNSLVSDYAQKVMGSNPNIPPELQPSPEYKNAAKGVASSLENLCKLFLPEEEFKPDMFQFLGCKELGMSMEIISNSLLSNDNNIDDACQKALLYGGVKFENVNDIADKENDLCNKGSEWNDTQIGVLTAYYKDKPNAKIAAMLGRTVYEVTKQAKKLGLKKSEKYLKETRIANLKKKQNG